MPEGRVTTTNSLGSVHMLEQAQGRMDKITGVEEIVLVEISG